MFLRALALALVVLWLGPASASACSMRFVSVFEQAEGAQTVALGRAAPWGMRARELMRGGPSRSVRIRYGNSTCAPRVRRGREVLVFVDAEHRLVAHHQSYFERPEPRLVDAVRRWTSAPDDEARRALLVELSAGSGQPARHAGFYLADRPDLLARLTSAERARLRDAVRSVPANHVGALAMALARTHDLAAADAILSRVDDVHYVEEIGIPLEILTNHQQPMPGFDSPRSAARWRRWRMGRARRRLAGDILGDNTVSLAVSIRAHWNEWIRGRGGATPEALLRAGYEERSVTPPDLSDASSLAAMVARGPDALSRVVALEQCERLRGRSFASFLSYGRGTSPQYWRTLATACETGTPPPY